MEGNLKNRYSVITLSDDETKEHASFQFKGNAINYAKDIKLGRSLEGKDSLAGSPGTNPRIKVFDNEKREDVYNSRMTKKAWGL